MELVRDDEELDELQFVINGIPRHQFNRFDAFNSYDEESFRKRFRLTKESALFVLNLIEPQIEHPTDYNNSIAPINQLLVYLRLLATGSHLALLGDFAGMHESTVSRTVVRVGMAVACLRERFVRMQQGHQEISSAQLQFYEIARFPRVNDRLYPYPDTRPWW